MNQTSTDISDLRFIASIIDMPYHHAAQSIERIAKRLEAREAEVNERLAIAGQKAAEAKQIANDLRRQLADEITNGIEEIERLQQLAQASQKRNEELVQELVFEKNNSLVARRVLAFLLDELQLSGEKEDEEPLSVRFQFTHDAGGLTPEEASDLALALSDIDGDETENA